MGIREKTALATESSWLTDSLAEEDRRTAEFIAAIAVSVQRRRRELGMTQEELADKLGVSRDAVSRWENGDEDFTAAALVKLSATLDLPLCNPLSA
jgi:DNA-binding XRE family transcriptional regulator